MDHLLTCDASKVRTKICRWCPILPENMPRPLIFDDVGFSYAIQLKWALSFVNRIKIQQWNAYNVIGYGMPSLMGEKKMIRLLNQHHHKYGTRAQCRYTQRQSIEFCSCVWVWRNPFVVFYNSCWAFHSIEFRIFAHRLDRPCSNSLEIHKKHNDRQMANEADLDCRFRLITAFGKHFTMSNQIRWKRSF